MESYVYLSLLCALGCAALQVEALYKCDSTVIAKIEKLWCGNHPTGLLDNAKRNVEEVTLAATKDYYPSNVKYIHATFKADPKYQPFTYVTAYQRLNDGTEKARDLFLGEYKGSTYDACNKVRRYHLPISKSVSGLYVCSEDETAKEGKPQGVIKSAAASALLASDDVEKAKKKLQEVGISIDVYYDKVCA